MKFIDRRFDGISSMWKYIISLPLFLILMNSIGGAILFFTFDQQEWEK